MKKIRAVAAALLLVLTVSVATQALPTTAAASDTPLKVVFIGDSYTDASFVPLGSPVPWGVRLCAVMGWNCVNLAHGGTGYLQAYAGQGSFTAQIPLAIAAAPDMVLVLGGRNELGQENTVVWQNGVTNFYSALRQGLPNATIYGLSPLWDDDPTPSGILTMRFVVQAAVAAANATYMDLGDPFLGQPNLITADGIHPNDAGMDVLMNLVMSHLPPAPPRTRTPDPSNPGMPGPRRTR